LCQGRHPSLGDCTNLRNEQLGDFSAPRQIRVGWTNETEKCRTNGWKQKIIQSFDRKAWRKGRAWKTLASMRW
jgi:hypothetical protein